MSAYWAMSSVGGGGGGGGNAPPPLQLGDNVRFVVVVVVAS